MDSQLINTLLSSLVDVIAEAVIAKLHEHSIITQAAKLAVDETLDECLNRSINIALNDREYNVREEIVEVIENMSFDVTVRSL